MLKEKQVILNANENLYQVMDKENAVMPSWNQVLASSHSLITSPGNEPIRYTHGVRGVGTHLSLSLTHTH